MYADILSLQIQGLIMFVSIMNHANGEKEADSHRCQFLYHGFTCKLQSEARYSFSSEQNNMIKSTSAFDYGELMMIEARINEFLAGQKEQLGDF